MSHYRLPNMLVLGAAKSGTTFVHQQLARHPEVFMSAVKEPTFFSDSFHVVGNPMDYAQLFASASDQRWVGESSHVSLSHPRGAVTVRTFLDPEKFIVLLRDPVERAWSLFEHMSRFGRERHRNFDAALAAERDRMQSRRVRNDRFDYYMNFAYVGSGRYAEQLQRYFDIFDQSRFYVRFYEELRDSPSDVMVDICNFLDVAPLAHIDQHAANAGGTVSRLPALTVGLYRASRRLPAHHGARLRATLPKLTRRSTTTMRHDTRLRLQTEFEADVAALEALLGRPVPWQWVHGERRGVTDRR